MHCVKAVCLANRLSRRRKALIFSVYVTEPMVVLTIGYEKVFSFRGFVR